MIVIHFSILVCLVCLSGCSTIPKDSIEYDVQRYQEVLSDNNGVRSVAVLDPLVDLRLHRLVGDPVTLSERSELLAVEERKNIHRTLVEGGLPSRHTVGEKTDRLNVQRLVRNLKQSVGEGSIDVTFPVNGLLANRLERLHPAETLLIAEYSGWEKTDDLKNKERLTSWLYKMVTFGLVDFNVPDSSKQEVRMFLVDSASGRALWSGRAVGRMADTRDMVNQLLSRLWGEVAGG